MTLKLYLMRHAEAENPGNKPDIERQLTNHGKLQAQASGALLQGQIIDKIIVSDATRTMQTCEIVQQFISPCPTDIVKELYRETEETILETLSLQEDQFNNILVIGHNPTIYNLALQIAENNTDEYEELLQTGMHPARLVLIAFPTINNWQEILTTKGKLFLF